jgi:hypothetical protein
MGWEGLAAKGGRRYVTHDQLVAAVYRDVPASRGRIKAMLAAYDWRTLREDLQNQVGFMCSRQRMSLVLTLLRRRIRLINRAISNL